MSDTAIEWATKVWNPVVGCSVVSPGCTNCYAMKMAARLEAMAAAQDTEQGHPGPLEHYRGTTRDSRAGAVWTGRVNVSPDRALLKPLRWKKPERVFVNSMSDLFHDSVPFEVVDRVFAVMALSPHHTYQLLTKRPERARAYIKGGWQSRLIPYLEAYGPTPGKRGCILRTTGGVLPNVWLGVSVEDQTRANERIPILLDTPAAVRWISAEPLLGPIDLSRMPIDGPTDDPLGVEPLTGRRAPQILIGPPEGWVLDGGGLRGARIDWVVAGGESGPGARPMHPDWARQLRDQCAAAGVPFLFKQWGDWGPTSTPNRARGLTAWMGGDGKPAAATAYLVGKKAAGRMLDGVLHDAYPERAA